jgi:hypothetical protein
MRVLTLALLLIAVSSRAQVTDSSAPKKDNSLLQMVDSGLTPRTEYVKATFKTTRLINAHSVEHIGAGVLDIKIQHRFGTLNGGFYELFGLDQATIRIGADYGITDWLMVGIGRSSFEKLYDGFAKFKLLRQSKGEKNSPISLSAFAGMYITSVEFFDSTIENNFTNRTSYMFQLISARKFSEGFSLQISPTWVHYNLVPNPGDPHDIFAIGFGGRQKLSRRVSFNVEYYYRVGEVWKGTVNPLSVGFDIETGGHVFQLMFTNSTGIAENQYIANTTGKWGDGDIHFGFNISRVFNIGNKKKEEPKKY